MTKRVLRLVPFLLLVACGQGDDAGQGRNALGEDDRCAADDCGPTPDIATVRCADGSTGGFTGVCEATSAGTCGWQIRECPPDTGGGGTTDVCERDACGPEPSIPTILCEDGSTSSGECGWEIRICPGPTDTGGGTATDVCDRDRCGPVPDVATWTCEDGTVGGFTGVCEATSTGCGWQIRDCR
jgi:hypothetical protein